MDDDGFLFTAVQHQKPVGFTDDHEMDLLSTQGLAEALWDLDGRPDPLTSSDQFSSPHGIAHHSHSSHGYATQPSPLYCTFDSDRIGIKDFWKSQNDSNPQPAVHASSSSPNILSFENQLPSSSAHFDSHAGYSHSRPDPNYHISTEAVATATMVPSSSRGGRARGESSGGASWAGAVTAGGGSKHSAAAQQDHIIAERKRREKLSQRFIALSAIVPGLKKTDKASVLGDAIKYMKQLQDRVQSLEQQAAQQTVESTVVVKKSHIPVDGGIASFVVNSDDQSNAVIDHPLPEIEAKVMDQNVLLRIHCNRRKAILVKIMAEVERLGLSVLNSSVIPFTGSVLDITIIAQMEEGFSMPVTDIVRGLHCAIKQLM